MARFAVIVCGLWLTSTPAGATPAPQCAPAAQRAVVGVGEGAGCGSDHDSWATAATLAAAHCRAHCAGACSESSDPTDQCAYDADVGGYRCVSSCDLPAHAFAASAAGSDSGAWAQAVTDAVAACAASGCAGGCSVSTSPSDQCAFDPLGNQTHCLSTCVCPAAATPPPSEPDPTPANSARPSAPVPVSAVRSADTTRLSHAGAPSGGDGGCAAAGGGTDGVAALLLVGLALAAHAWRRRAA